MKLYLADTVFHHYRKTVGLSDKPVRLLGSFYYFEKTDMNKEFERSFPIYPDFMADSGIYSAYVKQITLDVAAYADWLHQWKHLFTTLVSLDDKIDYKRGLSNLKYLEGRGLKVIPVFHIGEPFSLFKEMCADYDYIGLGGMWTSLPSTDVFMRVSEPFFSYKPAHVKIHGFGMTRHQLLMRFPYYSVDSSAWGSGFRYGSLQIFDDRTGKWERFKLGDVTTIRRLIPLITDYGFDAIHFMDRGQSNHKISGRLMAAAYLRYEAWINRIKGETPYD